MAFVINYTRTINAPLAIVWEVITDLPRYGEWNRFCIACASTLKVGEPIVMTVKLMAKPQRQQEVIFEHVPNDHLCYGLDGGRVKAILSNRCHRVSALDANRTRYVSEFQLSGWLMPLVRLLMRSKLEKGFEVMSDGIQQRAELLHGQKKP